MVRVSIIYLLCLCSAFSATLPIYLEDSHAGSFGFFAETLDLEKEYTLILIDAHSDASGIAGSDSIRASLREVLSESDRKKVIKSLRTKGTIQPHNWIEPLMPKPFSEVVWIAADALTIDKKNALEKEADAQLDWKAEFAERACGDLGGNYQVMDWVEFSQWKTDKPVVVSIDLDYFTHLEKPKERLQQVWRHILQIPRLEAVSFSLSRPWQIDDLQAESLFLEAFHQALNVSNSQIFYEPFLTDLHDRSAMAKSYLAKGELPPRFELARASNGFKQLILQNRHRISVAHNTLQWETHLAEWSSDLPDTQLVMVDTHRSIDGVWRLNSDHLADIWILDSMESKKEPQKVIWWLIEPEHDSYNILADSGLGKGFTGEATSYITMKKRQIAVTQDLALSSDTWSKQLDHAHGVDVAKGMGKGMGIVKLQAELVFPNSSSFSSVMEIRVRKNEGFLGSLEEQFHSPYVFGIGMMKDHHTSTTSSTSTTTGPETLVGNDCANFLVYGWRQQGITLPWCNPKQLKSHLTVVDPKSITNEQIQQGLVIHLGSHVAAMWEDLGIIGEVDDQDLVIHHLTGFPEILSLAKLAKGKSYQVYQLSTSIEKVKLAIAGDISLAGDIPKPFISEATIKLLTEADLAIANLECVLTDDTSQREEKRFSYLVSPEKATNLQCFDLLTLANNHTGDGGEIGYLDTIKTLEELAITSLGAGDIEQSCSVKVLQVGEETVGFIAFNTIENESFISNDNEIGVACYPEHKLELEKALTNAEVDFLIALPHWGDEYTALVNDKQREIAKWLIDHGVDLVAGAHTHHIQPIEFYQGKCVAYSLGNFIFAPQSRTGFNDHFLALVELSQTKKGVKKLEIQLKNLLDN
ncbi:CapA family protein [Akkermansiaceae bacterium]|nr:CapA family protein [Akkermansiaceae bacterium]